jgi:hypothetical protein
MASPLARIAADNDPRNGGVAARLIRMSEHPEREPDADGLYGDEYSQPDYLAQLRASQVEAVS